MGYKFAGIDVLNVPGRTDLDELGFLGALANRVRPGGTIVEVGPFFGRTTCVMARANPNARIVAIDPFEEAAWTRRYSRSSPVIPRFSKSSFDRYTHDLPNISAIKGVSPAVVSDWTEPIDMYFEDAVHGNPALKSNLNFWSARLRPGGILCGHDYGIKFPDVKREVDAIAASWKTTVHIVGSLWAVQKPRLGNHASDQIPEHFSVSPQLQLRGENKRRGACKANSGFWLGAHLEADRLNWFTLQTHKDCTANVEVRLGHPEFGITKWQNASRRNCLIYEGKMRPFSRVAIRVAPNPVQDATSISYRVSARQIGNNGFLFSGTSPWFENGAWAHVSPEGPAVNAIAVCLGPAPPHSQIAFPQSPQSRLNSLAKQVVQQVLT